MHSLGELAIFTNLSAQKNNDIIPWHLCGIVLCVYFCINQQIILLSVPLLSPLISIRTVWSLFSLLISLQGLPCSFKGLFSSLPTWPQTQKILDKIVPQISVKIAECADREKYKKKCPYWAKIGYCTSPADKASAHSSNNTVLFVLQMRRNHIPSEQTFFIFSFRNGCRTTVVVPAKVRTESSELNFMSFFFHCVSFLGNIRLSSTGGQGGTPDMTKYWLQVMPKGLMVAETGSLC